MDFDTDSNPIDVDEHPYAALTPDAVIDAVEHCGYWSDARILALNSYENRVYQVGIEDGEPLIVKFYRPDRWSQEQIQEEHDFLFELEAAEFPVVAPLRNDSGNSLHEYLGFAMALFPRRGGHAPELDNLDDLLVLGRFMGRMHSVGATRPFQHRPALSLHDYAISSAGFLLEREFIPADLRPAYSSLSRDLIEKMQAASRDWQSHAAIRLHGDCHPGNILYRDEHAFFVDYDDCRSGPAIQDLWMLLSGDRQQKLAQLAEIVDGYNEFHDFPVRQLPLIETLRTMRMMHYSAWLARRWHDPAFPMHFPWFNTDRYWASHILELREQMVALDEAPLELF